MVWLPKDAHLIFAFVNKPCMATTESYYSRRMILTPQRPDLPPSDELDDRGHHRPNNTIINAATSPRVPKPSLSYLTQTIPLLKWGRRLGVVNLGAQVCLVSARLGHLEALLYARSRGCEWNESTMMQACAGGNMAVVRKMVEQGCPFDSLATAAAARYVIVYISFADE